jgi:hypothetical protein
MCNKGEIPATQMMYKSRTKRYYTYNVVEQTPGSKHVPIKRNEVDPKTLDQYNEKLVEWATQNHDKWVGPTVKDANVRTGDAPLELCTKVSINNTTILIASRIHLRGRCGTAGSVMEQSGCMMQLHNLLI